MKTWSLESVKSPHWQYKESAVIVFIVQGERILLIHKKTGLGKGLINGPGGRIEPGESPEEAAVREVQEELLISINNPIHLGLLHFQFTDGYSLKGHVYKTDNYQGIAQETREAKPLWVDIDNIPYDKMWQDDKLWMPLLLNDTHFKGYFIFDNERMVEHCLYED
ncbi:MAG: 8-oxo-dGTP diphosphatase [Spirochaetaceae bacterium]|nr:8-oxo-dGTP diphosphatase [Spirochaetaceae bacterium]